MPPALLVIRGSLSGPTLGRQYSNKPWLMGLELLYGCRGGCIQPVVVVGLGRAYNDCHLQLGVSEVNPEWQGVIVMYACPMCCMSASRSQLDCGVLHIQGLLL